MQAVKQTEFEALVESASAKVRGWCTNMDTELSKTKYKGFGITYPDITKWANKMEAEIIQTHNGSDYALFEKIELHRRTIREIVYLTNLQPKATKEV